MTRGVRPPVRTRAPRAPGPLDGRLTAGRGARAVAAGREYSFQGVRVRPFTEESHRAANMCASRFVIPLKPTGLPLPPLLLSLPVSLLYTPSLAQADRCAPARPHHSRDGPPARPPRPARLRRARGAALVLRTHVLAAPASGPLPAEAAMQMATEPGCTRQARRCPPRARPLVRARRAVGNGSKRGPEVLSARVLGAGGLPVMHGVCRRGRRALRVAARA